MSTSIKPSSTTPSPAPGVLEPAFHSIISAGENNFCIHYDSYMGQAKDGDMILNDVGAQWDGECNDVSRGWPCNGKYSKEQRMLYACALNTSNYIFSLIKPVCSWTMWIRPPAAIAVSS